MFDFLSRLFSDCGCRRKRRGPPVVKPLHKLRTKDTDPAKINSRPLERASDEDSILQESVDGWTQLLQHVAPNGLHNASARCCEGTRTQIICETMAWIESKNLQSESKKVLFITGRAGCGKTTLQQTLAERSGIHTSSFFASATDPTRNTVESIFPTIAYQLGCENPALKQLITSAVEEHHSIFSQPLETQITTLIVDPFKRFQKSHGSDGGSTRSPYVILIDGLDECGGEEVQADLSAAITQTLLADDLPFRIIISGRSEGSICTAMAPGGHLDGAAWHLRLDDYDAAQDMQLYSQLRLSDLFGPDTPHDQRPTEDDVESLVQSAQGQFVYLATVFNYLAVGTGSPAEKLKAVLACARPQCGPGFTHPSNALDTLYTNILLNAKHAYERVNLHAGRDFLLLLRLYQVNENFGLAVKLPVDILTAVLDLESDGLEKLTSDMRSLVSLDRQGELRLRALHRSFSDFWRKECRAKGVFVPGPRIDAHLARCCLRHIIQCPAELHHLPDRWGELPHGECRKGSFQAAVWYLPWILECAMSIDDDLVHFSRQGGWEKVDRLLPFAYRDYPNFFASNWAICLEKFVDNLNDRIPEVVTVLSGFLAKWDRDIFGWRSEPRNLLEVATLARAAG